MFRVRGGAISNTGMEIFGKGVEAARRALVLDFCGSFSPSHKNSAV
jgi:hypothetical protein